MRLVSLLASLLLLSACSKTDSNAMTVFESAFSGPPPRDVAVLHGYRLERRKWFESAHMWRLHLAGPGAKRFVNERWPDLQPGIRRIFVQGSQTPWFAPGKELKYVTFGSAADPAVTVMQPEIGEEVFVAYDGL